MSEIDDIEELDDDGEDYVIVLIALGLCDD
jgi:hypothetical protein